MRPDLYTISWPESCLLLLAISVLLARYFSPMQVCAHDLILLVFVASRHTSYDIGGELLCQARNLFIPIQLVSTIFEFATNINVGKGPFKGPSPQEVSLLAANAGVF
jgi:hypothetical protein